MNLMEKVSIEQVRREAFFMMPKWLLMLSISNDARVLYTLISDRYSLSVKNNWVDEQGYVYCYYTRENMANDLGRSSKQTIKKIINELIDHNLLVEVRQGFGKPNRIYVQQPSEIFIDTLYSNTKRENNKKDIKASSNCVFNSSSSESQNLRFKSLKNCDSRVSKFEIQESQNLSPNNTNINNTNINKNHIISYQEDSTNIYNKNNRYDNDIDNDIDINNIYLSDDLRLKDIKYKMDDPSTNNTDMYNKIKNLDIDTSVFTYKQKINYYKNKLKWQIEYNHFTDRSLLDDLLNIAIEVLMMNKNQTIKINKNEISVEHVQEIYKQLDYFQIEYVINSFKTVTNKITNIKSYLRTALYNAHATMDSYYDNLVRKNRYEASF